MQTENIGALPGATPIKAPPLAVQTGKEPMKRWHWLTLGAIVVLGAFLNVYKLTQNGYGNQYYAAAVRSMIQSWHNFFFVAFDPGGFVTVDKPPLGLWIQAAFARVLGFSGLTLLLPQAIAGVLSIIVLYCLVRRTFGPLAGLLAALMLAVTPISVVMNRDNNLDTVLVLTMLLAAWATLRAVETGKLSWLLLALTLTGLGFNIKTLEMYLILPAQFVVFMVAAPLSWRGKIWRMGVALLLMLVISFAWIEAVDLTPASQRPWVDSTSTNSEMDLTLGYNGLSRLLGMGGGFGGGNRGGGTPRDFNSSQNSSTTTTTRTTLSSTTRTSSTSSAAATPGANNTQNSTNGNGNGNTPFGDLTSAQLEQIQNAIGGGGGNGFVNDAASPWRLFQLQLGSQVSWLLPLALCGLLALLWQRRWFLRPRRPELNRQQQATLLWGVWLLTMGAFFSVAGFFHPYYLVIIAPAICALSSAGLVTMWQDYRQRNDWRRWMLPVALLVTAGEQAYLIAQYQDWKTLEMTVAVLCLLAAGGLIWLKTRSTPATTSQPTAPRTTGPVRNARIWQSAAVTLGVLALLLTPTIWSGISIASAENTTLPSAGPTSTGNRFGFGGNFPGGNREFRRFGDGSTSSESANTNQGNNGNTNQENGAGGTPPTGYGPGGYAPNGGYGSSPTNGGAPATSGYGYNTENGNSSNANSARNGGGGFGGDSASVDSKLVSFLLKNRGNAKFILATTNSNSAAPYIIVTGEPVMSMGGFSGSNPILTQSSLAALVKAGTVRYFSLNGMGGGGGDNASSWVTSNCTTITSSAWGESTGASGGVTELYDCGKMIGK